ncbi:hypothetical protein [Bauldia sp.]|uniref:hypothetical protein n=1 Tax=Bauldia sp. TaxID=2575872 RepID=UPI003BADA1D3
MAEYYTVLKRAVAGADPSVPDARRAVYDKARNALIGQLKAVDPPLTTAEISRQRLELEEAIRRVERETMAGIGAAPPQHAAPAGAATPPPEPPPPPAPNPATPPPASPQDIFRRAIRDAGIQGAPATGERPPAHNEPPRYTTTAPDLRPQEEQMMPPRGPGRRPPADPGYAAPSHQAYEAEPRLAPEYDQDWERGAPQGQGHPPPGPQVDGRDRLAFTQQPRGRGYAEVDDDDLVDRRPKRSRLPGILLTVLIVALLGGAGALAWSQQDVIMDLIASFESDEPPTLEAPPVEPAAASTKNTDRLLEGEVPEAPPLAPAPDRDVRVVGEDADPTPELATAAVADPPPLPAATDGSGISGVQRALLLEEPVNGAEPIGIDADVTWRFVETGPNGPEVEARLEVPERNMIVRFALHRNADDTLPASHLIQVTVDTPADFPGGAVNEIPSVVLKPTEDDRGQQLVGAAVKVADGFFWVALSANQNDIASNLALLRSRNWIDLPFVYGNGQRAILSFEKGGEGAQVFEQALAAWGTG